MAPYYHRHKFDGTITNNVVYPLTRALYGQQVRQPIGGDFGVSRALVRHYLGLPVWDTDVARYGIDIWMTTDGDLRRLLASARRFSARSSTTRRTPAPI